MEFLFEILWIHRGQFSGLSLRCLSPLRTFSSLPHDSSLGLLLFFLTQVFHSQVLISIFFSNLWDFFLCLFLISGFTSDSPPVVSHTRYSSPDTSDKLSSIFLASSAMVNHNISPQGREKVTICLESNIVSNLEHRDYKDASQNNTASKKRKIVAKYTKRTLLLHHVQQTRENSMMILWLRPFILLGGSQSISSLIFLLFLLTL